MTWGQARHTHRGSGAGKTSIALAIERTRPELKVFRADTIGVPSAEEMKAWGPGHEPGGAWQRWLTLEWVARIEPLYRAGDAILLEGQMRPAFIQEALALQGIETAQVVLVECEDCEREQRLIKERRQPELANEDMRNWSRYLHEEAVALGYEVLGTGSVPISASIKRILEYFDSWAA